jgi:hypothetical protein
MEMYWMYIFSKTMFSSSLPPVVSRRAHLIYAKYVCLRIVVTNTHCVVFLLSFFLVLLPVSFDCPFLIAPLVIQWNNNLRVLL